MPLNAAVVGMFIAQAPPTPAPASEEAPSSVPSAPEVQASASVDASKDEAGTSAAAGEEDEEAGEVKDDEPKGLSERSIPPRSNCHPIVISLDITDVASKALETWAPHTPAALANSSAGKHCTCGPSCLENKFFCRACCLSECCILCTFT